MSRDEIVNCTYQAGLKLNELKMKYGLIDRAAFNSTKERIKLAMTLTAEIDKINEIDDSSTRKRRLMQLKPKLDAMLDSVINEKRYMEWPAAEGNLRIFRLIKMAVAGIFAR